MIAQLRPVACLWLVASGCATGPSEETSGASAAQDTDDPTGGSTSDDTNVDPDSTGDTTGDGDAAEVIDAALPTALTCGAQSSASVTLLNAGGTTWTTGEGYALGAVDDSDPLSRAGRIALPGGAAVAPGDSVTFELTLTASAEPGVVHTDWQMLRENVAWFGDIAQSDVEVTCTPGSPGGPVYLQGRSFADDGGPFVALGATMMWAAWAYRNDRPRLESNLAFLADNGFHYIRALGVVGDPALPDYWDGREIEFAWPDYVDVVEGLTALAYDEYGLRIEWTLIGDGQVAVPTPAERDLLVQRFVTLADARPEAIIHFEIANEYWQNGFGGPDGLIELRTRTAALRDDTAVLVAASAGISDACSELLAIYDGDIADIATVHTERDLGTSAGPWGPVLRPNAIDCAGLPPATNNEPIGPGASVATEDDPERLVAAALASWLAGWPAYVFHSGAGVLGFEDLSTAAGVDAYAAIVPTLPGDLASWMRRASDDPQSALRMYATVGGELVPDAAWTDVGGEAGVIGLLQSDAGDQVVALAVGILGTATLEARAPISLQVVDILSAATVLDVELAAQERFELSGAGARLLRATRL